MKSVGLGREIILQTSSGVDPKRPGSSRHFGALTSSVTLRSPQGLRDRLDLDVREPRMSAIDSVPAVVAANVPTIATAHRTGLPQVLIRLHVEPHCEQ